MKRTIAVILLLITISLFLVGCDGLFYGEYFVKLLESNGFVQVNSCVTPEEIEMETKVLNMHIYAMGYDFTVEVLSKYTVAEEESRNKYCIITTFATEEQAQQYAAFQLEYYSHNNPNNRRLAQIGRVVITSNSEKSMEIIKLRFR